MAELDKGKSVSLEELMVSTLAMTDALAKLLIEKGVITDAEFKKKLLQERGVYQPHSESNGAIKREAGPMSYQLNHHIHAGNKHHHTSCRLFDARNGPLLVYPTHLCDGMGSRAGESGMVNGRVQIG